MILTNEQIKQFQALCEEHFAIKPGFDEAQKNGIQLVRLMQLIYKPMRKQDYQNINDNKNYNEQARTKTNL